MRSVIFERTLYMYQGCRHVYGVGGWDVFKCVCADNISHLSLNPIQAEGGYEP